MQLFASDLWLMEPNYLRQFEAMAAATFKAAAGGPRTPRVEQSRAKNVGLIRVHGAIETRPTELGQFLGMPSYEAIGQQFDAWMIDDSVSSIIFDIASPGGMVYGAMELAEKVFQSRGKKPTLAVANPVAASGAYWLASAAERLIVTPSGDVGSVGVISEHVDISAMLERVGEKVTVIRSSKSPYKAESTSVQPLSEEGMANLQARADTIYNQFVGDLARFRGVSVDYINDNFGKGRVVDAKSALKVGMVDRIDTFDGIVGKVLSGRLRLGNTAANDEWEAPTSREQRLSRVQQIVHASSIPHT